MEKDLTAICRTAVGRPIELLDECINNCPDSLWGKICAGEFYWRHIYHALAAIWVFFPREGRLRSDSTALSGTTAATLGDEYKDKAPDKNIIRQVVREAQKHLDLYFDSLDDSILFAEVEFSNRKLLLIELVVTASRHTTYNVGICDGALRDNGAHPVVVPYKGGEWGLPPSLKTGGGRS